jgi:N-hydroxyarylamine O-acetyltransferase
MFSTKDYLKRIRIGKVLNADSDFLSALHYSHLRYIPYENFSIINKTPFSLDEDDLFEKMIKGCRGGFCYELIFLFKRLLSELGYDVELLSARIFHRPDLIQGPEFDHSILSVKIKNESWLVDVGNALWFSKPLLIDSEDIQIQNHQSYRILKNNEDEYTLFEKSSYDNKEIPQYRFNLKPRLNSDFNDICHYKWTSPDSKFTKEYICSRITDNGRIYLKESGLKIFDRDKFTELPVADKDAFRFYLSKYFPYIESGLVK